LTTRETPISGIIQTLLRFYLSQFFNSIIILIGVAGVIYLIEYGELGTLYGNLISCSLYSKEIDAAFSILLVELLLLLP